MTAKPPSAAELAATLTDHSTALINSLRVNSTALAENSTALIKSLRVKVLDSAELVKSLRVKVQDTAALLKSLKKGERLALITVGSAAAATAVVLLWRRHRRLPPPPPPAVALEDIAKYPGRAAVGVIDAPKSLAFAPGDAAVTYLASPPGSTSQKLYSLDLASGTVSELLGADADESTYTAEEKLRRERLRMLHTGVTEYSWSNTGGVMLVPQGSRSLVAIRTSLGGAPVTLRRRREGQPAAGGRAVPRRAALQGRRVLRLRLRRRGVRLLDDGHVGARPGDARREGGGRDPRRGELRRTGRDGPDGRVVALA